MVENVFKEIKKLKEELNTLRIENVMGRLKNFNKIKVKKREIARSFTKLNQGKKMPKPNDSKEV